MTGELRSMRDRGVRESRTAAPWWRVVLAAGLVLLGAAPSGATGGALLDEVVSLVEENIFDPSLLDGRWRVKVETARAEIESGAEDTGTVRRLLEELGTSHTGLYTKDDREYYDLLSIFRFSLESSAPHLYRETAPRYEGIGVFTRRLEGRTFVSSVIPGGPGDEAGLRRGDELVAQRGVASFRGRAGEAVPLGVRREADGPVEELMVVPDWLDPSNLYLDAMRTSARTFERRGRTIGYLRAWSYAGEPYQDVLEEILLDGSLASAEALVLDLRDGWGGANPDVLSFFAPVFPRLSFIGRDGRVRNADRAWRKPVTLLVDRTTRSGKEILAFGFRREDTGAVVGERTAGAVLGGRVFALSGGSLLYLPVFDVRVDGERLEGRGVAPTVEVPAELPYSAGTDPQLDRALAVAGRAEE